MYVSFKMGHRLTVGRRRSDGVPTPKNRPSAFLRRVRRAIDRVVPRTHSEAPGNTRADGDEGEHSVIAFTSNDHARIAKHADPSVQRHLNATTVEERTSRVGDAVREVLIDVWPRYASS